MSMDKASDMRVRRGWMWAVEEFREMQSLQGLAEAFGIASSTELMKSINKATDRLVRLEAEYTVMLKTRPEWAKTEREVEEYERWLGENGIE